MYICPRLVLFLSGIQNTLLPFVDDLQCWCHFWCRRNMILLILQKRWKKKRRNSKFKIIRKCLRHLSNLSCDAYLSSLGSLSLRNSKHSLAFCWLSAMLRLFLVQEKYDFINFAKKWTFYRFGSSLFSKSACNAFLFCGEKKLEAKLKKKSCNKCNLLAPYHHMCLGNGNVYFCCIPSSLEALLEICPRGGAYLY